MKLIIPCRQSVLAAVDNLSLLVESNVSSPSMLDDPEAGLADSDPEHSSSSSDAELEDIEDIPAPELPPPPPPPPPPTKQRKSKKKGKSEVTEARRKASDSLAGVEETAEGTFLPPSMTAEAQLSTNRTCKCTSHY
jgi:hypothetical protein